MAMIGNLLRIEGHAVDGAEVGVDDRSRSARLFQDNGDVVLTTASEQYSQIGAEDRDAGCRTTVVRGPLTPGVPGSGDHLAGFVAVASRVQAFGKAGTVGKCLKTQTQVLVGDDEIPAMLDRRVVVAVGLQGAGHGRHGSEATRMVWRMKPAGGVVRIACSRHLLIVDGQ